MHYRIDGAQVLQPDGSLTTGTVAIAEGTILDRETARPERRIDATGLLLLPGIIDLHGDAFERQLMPRPQVMFPTDVALIDTDRQLAANGITTAFHGLTWSWEPGLRGRDAAIRFLDALDRLRPVLGCDNRVHLRHEMYNIEAAAEIEGWLSAGRIHLLALNDHLPMFQRRLSQPAKLAQYAERAHMSLDEFIALIHWTAERAPEVPGVNRRLTRAAREAGLPLASHDDDSPEIRRHFHDLGCTLCEFPTTRDTAAHDLNDGVIMGAPNVVRGGSHSEGGMRAADLIADGLVDALTSDYYYPALLHAAFRLAEDGICPLGHAWRLISAHPARLAGFSDRGAIAAGQRADLILVDDARMSVPRVVATFAGGRLVHATKDLIR